MWSLPPFSTNIDTKSKLDLPYIYRILKMHKNPYKHRFIAGSSKCSNKPLSVLLTKLLTNIKQVLQKYCETAYNQMWILKNSKELLEHLKISRFQPAHKHQVLRFFDPLHNHSHQKLKSRLATIIRNSFIHRSQIHILGFRSRRTLFCLGTI